MPHFPKPFYRKSRDLWYIQIDGVQYNLGRCSEEEAQEKASDLKKELRKPATPTLEFVETVAVKFVQWTAKNRSAGTAQWYKNHLESFLKHAGDLTVDELKPYHLDDWCDAHPNWSDGTRRGGMTAVQRCLNWAVKKGHIPFSPIASIEKPQGGKRDYLITEGEYQQILTNTPNDDFRDLLEVSWEAGPRPQESAIVEAHHVDVKNARWIFETQNSKGKKRQRVVYLNDRAMTITKRLMLKYPAGPLFRMNNGKPWTPDAVNCQFLRLQRRLATPIIQEKKIVLDEREIQATIRRLKQTKRVKGKEVLKTTSDLREEARLKLRTKLASEFAPKFCLYLFRHAWMTRLLQAGVDPITVSILAGHVDTSMLARQYQHLSHDPEYLLGKAKRA